jgi:hypothetical protein
MSEIIIPPLSNCLSNAFMKLGDDFGNAPQLRYSLEQKAAFTAYGQIMLPLEQKYFKDNTLIGPTLETDPNVIAEQISNESYFDGQSSFIHNAVPLSFPNLPTIANANITTQAVNNYNQQTNNTDTSTLRSTDGSLPDAPDTNEVAQTLYVQYLAQMIAAGNAPTVVENMGRFKSTVKFIKRPLAPNPTLFIIEEYKTVSFLGSYGAGQTLNTFTLLPGEKTTISVKTFKEITSTENRSDSVVDSFSESSATDLEKSLQEESSFQSTDSDTSASSITKAKSKSASVDVSASASFLKISAKASAHAEFSSATNTTENISSSSARSTNVNNLSKAVGKQVESSNSNRNVSVNTSTQDSYKESTETAVVRELINPNQSRVLNFVFRQLLQEYVTITYLDNIKIAYSNGHPESFRVVSIQELDILLTEVIVSDSHDEVRNKIVGQYFAPGNYAGPVINHAGAPFKLLRKVNTVRLSDGTPMSYYTKRPDLVDTYTSGSLSIPVPGIILNVDRHILRTDSVIADALLGQGEALDCFNAHSQEAKKQALYIENQKQLLALNTLAEITDPIQRAEYYTKMFNPPPPSTTPTN